jgi:hypothetical protein
MRRMLAIALGLLALAFPATTSGRTTSAELAMSAEDASFKLFGTTFCLIDSKTSTQCDLAVTRARMLTPLPDVQRSPRWSLFGLTFCLAKTATGPACDVVWAPPTPTVAWRDYPEVRLAEDMPAP